MGAKPSGPSKEQLELERLQLERVEKERSDAARLKKEQADLARTRRGGTSGTLTGSEAGEAGSSSGLKSLLG